MSNTQITARINDQTLSLVNTPLLASGSEGVLQIICEFDALWDGYGKVGVFYRNKTEVYHVPLVAGVVEVPKEVLTDEGYFYFGIMGVAENIRTTEQLKIRIVQGAITTATAAPEEPTPDIYQQLLAAYGALDSRVEAMLARKTADGSLSYALSDEYINGALKTNGANAYIEFTITGVALVGGGHHYTDYCIPPALAPLGPVELKTSNSDINVTMETASSEGWARMLIENVSSDFYDTDMVTTVSAYYPLAEVFINELSDLRAGMNGTVYSSAGTAVREQLLGLRTRIEAVERALNLA